MIYQIYNKIPVQLKYPLPSDAELWIPADRKWSSVTCDGLPLAGMDLSFINEENEEELEVWKGCFIRFKEQQEIGGCNV